MVSTGDALRTARRAARPRISLAQMAQLTSYSKSYLGNTETGTKPANPYVVAAYESILGLPGGSLLEDTPQRRALLAGMEVAATTLLPNSTPAGTLATGDAARVPIEDWRTAPQSAGPVHIGSNLLDDRAISQLRYMRDHFQEMYRRVGGAPTGPRITAALMSHGAPLLATTYDNASGQQLVRAVGGLTALAGVCAYDADMQATAQQRFFQALRMAKAAGDVDFGCYVVALLANQAMHLGNYRLVVQYAEDATQAASGKLSAQMAADLHSLAAKAYARMGDAQLCHRQLRTTEQVASNLDVGPTLVEASYMTPGLVETQLAEALRRLGDSAAHEYARESVRTAEATHIRGQVHRYAGLSLILANRGDIEESVHAAGEMLDRANGMESGRLRDRIGTVMGALQPYSDKSEVAELIHRADTVATLGA